MLMDMSGVFIDAQRRRTGLAVQRIRVEQGKISKTLTAMSAVCTCLIRELSLSSALLSQVALASQLFNPEAPRRLGREVAPELIEWLRCRQARMHSISRTARSGTTRSVR